MDSDVGRNAMPGLIMLCAARIVRAGAPVRVERGGTAYAVFNLDGAWHVTQDECTHGPGSLSEGWAEGDEIECPFHQGRFHIPTGQPTAPPCTIPLRVWPVHLINEEIWIDTTEGGSSSC
jgi:nitrite reductase/ring-hydroxylating ferredoxin subunit